MPGLQGESVVAPLASPIKKGRLSLKFFQKRETKRALDFSEPPTDEPKEEEAIASCDQVVPGPSPSPASPCALLPSEKTEVLLPFVGLNNLGNTCYLNSVLQVLYYCPGLRDGIKKLYSQSKRKDTPKEEMVKSEDEAESVPAHMELLGSFNSLIASVEQLQSDFLLNPAGYGEGELATPPRKLLHTLRQLNPMYEGYLQHDAQEVLQCILGYIQEASVTIRKERQAESEEAVGDATEVKPTGQLARAIPAPSTSSAGEDGDDGQVSGKRKSDTEAGNAKKKPKSGKSKKSDADDNVEKPFTRSKRKSSNAAPGEGVKKEEEEEVEVKKYNGEVAGGTAEGKGESASKVLEEKSKKRARMTRWLMPSAKQPSIFSKFRSMGKISSAVPAARSQSQTEQEGGPDQDLTQAGQESQDQTEMGKASKEPASGDGQEQKAVQNQDGLDLLEQLFQGRLVLRTRCLECESYTERREDFQDISVPVQEDQPSSPDELPEVSPDPKAEHKTLKWAISQFASVERIVGEDKYFCETCLHYTEAERSLLFDKTPEVITIHLKCFSANGLELDPYAGLSKVNTPLQTPLTLSLEEWCARPSSPEGRHYQLFAVVMHSGVTISSGHYTAYVRMSDLQDVRLRPQGKREQKTEEQPGDEDGGRQEEEAAHYDDGEVSFCLGGARGPQRREAAGSGKVGGKKLSEGGVGLLGGQRRVSSSYELGSGKQADKTSNGGAKEGSRRRLAATPGPKKEAAAGCDARGEAGAEAAATAACSTAGPEATEERALSGLLQYEGKWMLFDDSEVRLFEEEDFLRACSPDTCSTSTPYLLFYRRMPQHTSTC